MSFQVNNKPLNALTRVLPLILCLLWVSQTWAQIEESIAINDDLDIPVTRYEAFADDAPILLWLPSSRGTSSKQAITAGALGDLDIETWIVDLHTAYFVDTGRGSVQHFQAQDIADLIRLAAKQTPRKVYVMTTDGVAKPGLEGIALYQQQAAQSGEKSAVGGAILFHPNLNYPAIEPGMPVSYVPIASNSTIPVYFIQPTISTKQWRSLELQEILQSGGSPVFMHPMPGIHAGFHMRPDEDLNEADFAQRERLPKDLKTAIKLLSLQSAVAAPEDISTRVETSKTKRQYGLNELKNRTALPLVLDNLDSQLVEVDYAKNQLSLVSFWASWCEPCIKELPSLKRLHDDYVDKGLRIITVNIGEEKQAIEQAVERFAMSDYTNLLDPEGIAMNAWHVYGYPSNFLITSDGAMDYGSIGGVEWDEAEVREIIEKLLLL
jgi:thiol-disulfide isomerase/thioredoxin